MTQTIQTERLLLRPIRPADAKDVVDGIGSFEVSRWLTHAPHPYSLQDAEAFIARNHAVFPEVAAIEFHGHFAGVCGVRREFGYWLAQKYWGNRIMGEAGLALLTHAFSAQDCSDIGSGYFIGNTRSRRVLEKLRFKPTHIETVTPLATGVTTRLQKMKLTRAMWEKPS
jgi:RimJ/RimL family protein N-acetyltransferase